MTEVLSKMKRHAKNDGDRYSELRPNEIRNLIYGNLNIANLKISKLEAEYATCPSSKAKEDLEKRIEKAKENKKKLEDQILKIDSDTKDQIKLANLSRIHTIDEEIEDLQAKIKYWKKSVDKVSGDRMVKKFSIRIRKLNREKGKLEGKEPDDDKEESELESESESDSESEFICFGPRVKPKQKVKEIDI